jgi:hypothetical protein
MALLFLSHRTPGFLSNYSTINQQEEEDNWEIFTTEFVIFPPVATFLV